jgi:hypothetical protein
MANSPIVTTGSTARFIELRLDELHDYAAFRIGKMGSEMFLVMQDLRAAAIA